MLLTQVFINHAGRLRSGWRALLFAIIFIVLAGLLGYFMRVALVVWQHLFPAYMFG